MKPFSPRPNANGDCLFPCMNHGVHTLRAKPGWLCGIGLAWIAVAVLGVVLCGCMGRENGRRSASATFAPASAVFAFPSYGPMWATNELPCSWWIVPEEDAETATLWMLTAQVTIPTNRIPLRLSLEFRSEEPWPAWISYGLVTNDGFITHQQPFRFAIPVNGDSTNGVRVMTD